MLKVMIADDEKLVCRLVQALADWEALGMEVVGTAENGIEALELVKKLRPDILITDIRMPGCSGLELIEWAKNEQPQLEIVIISGYAHFEYAQSAIKYGVGNYLLKPIQQNELMETLEKMRERCIERMSSREEAEREYQSKQEDLQRLRISLVKDLLSGNALKLNKVKLKNSYHFMGEGECYQTFLLKIDCDIRVMNGAALKIVREKSEEILNLGLSKVCREQLLYFQDYAGYGIINYNLDKKKVVRKTLRECLNQLEAKKSLFGPITFSMALGDTVEDPVEIEKSLQSAKSAIQERLLESTGRILEDVPRGSGRQKCGELDRYAKMMEHAIEVLDTGEALRASRQLQETALSIPDLCGREILELVITAGTMFITRVGIRDIKETQQEFNLVCSQCHEVSRLFQELERLQEKLLQQVKEVRSNEATRPIRIAKQYVMQHYREQITLEEVCEAIGFSVSYFSTMFKKETGEGFSKYLTRVRIEEAKDLLRETNMSVAEICEQVGYSDRKHFTSTFHKATGLNPAEYRKLYG